MKQRTFFYFLCFVLILLLTAACGGKTQVDQDELQITDNSPTVSEQPDTPAVPATAIVEETGDALIFRGNPERAGKFVGPGPTEESAHLAWKFQTGGPIKSSAAFASGSVYFGSADGLYALNSQDGALLWLFKPGSPVNSSPAVAWGKVFFGADDGIFYAVDRTTGQEIWRFAAGGMITSSPVVDQDTVYFGSWDGFLYALDAQTGQERWRFEVAGIVDDASGIHKGISAAPALSEGLVLFGTTQRGGASAELYFYALDSQTGQKRWEYPLWNQVTTAAVSDGVVYFGGFGTLTGLKVSDGSLVLDYSTDIVSTAPAIADGVAFFGCDDGSLIAVDLLSGQQKWTVSEGITSAPSVSNGMVYFGNDLGTFTGVAADGGWVLSAFITGSPIRTAPVLVEGVAYFGNDEGFFFAVK